MRGNKTWILGLVLSLLAGFSGVADQAPEEWRETFIVIGLMGSALNGILIQRKLLPETKTSAGE